MKLQAIAIGLAVLGWATAAIADDATFDSNGVKIRYVTAGEGEPVVLIHGWMADSSMWGRDPAGNTKLDTKDTDGFQLIALDCRGHGKSDKPREKEKYGQEMAEDVVRLLDHLKIEKAHLIGYSSGAYIAGYVCAHHPERVRSVVFGGQAPIFGTPAPNDFSECEIFAQAVADGKGLGPYLIAVTPSNQPKPTAEQANSIAKFLYKDKDVEAFALAGLAFKQLAVSEEQLKKLEAPVLFIHGGEESDHVKSKVASARKILDRSEIKVIEGGTHITTLAKPEFGTAIIEFLRANRSK